MLTFGENNISNWQKSSLKLVQHRQVTFKNNKWKQANKKEKRSPEKV